MVYFTADDNGRCPIFAVRIGTGEVERVTTDDAAYQSLCPAADGRCALRAARVGQRAAGRGQDRDQPAARHRVGRAGPAAGPGRPGSGARAGGGGDSARRGRRATVRGWLVLPDGACAQSRAPLVLWVHGGPVMSWNSWSWRWNPWLMAARGYAVLLPDPALSTGYGQDFIARGHGTWGGQAVHRRDGDHRRGHWRGRTSTRTGPR